MSDNPDKRPLPPGWVTQYDPNYKTWFYVNTRAEPPPPPRDMAPHRRTAALRPPRDSRTAAGSAIAVALRPRDRGTGRLAAGMAGSRGMAGRGTAAVAVGTSRATSSPLRPPSRRVRPPARAVRLRSPAAGVLPAAARARGRAGAGTRSEQRDEPASCGRGGAGWWAAVGRYYRGLRGWRGRRGGWGRWRRLVIARGRGRAARLRGRWRLPSQARRRLPFLALPAFLRYSVDCSAAMPLHCHFPTSPSATLFFSLLSSSSRAVLCRADRLLCSATYAPGPVRT
ncbi:hypothetical protein CALCODRAFT_278193 [Calocera cornea HHB12733]|uniref:Uncharacterized protein n=1 Tax=Calocera cornea HHB12733 TaxID=1353952 RepID=A0A165JQC7_9BASI|nr:hypothetical protein CALCODRAFT_278193 [Calocera cornea HHB12733]